MQELAVFTTSQVARRLYVDPSTVRLWVKEGKLQPLTRTQGGHYRFSGEAIDKLAQAALQPTPSPELSPQSPPSGEGVSLSSDAA